MRIQTNVESLNAYRNLNNTNRSMSQSMERLSSGFRINRAADDAAGLAISEKMRGQIRGLNQATRNAQDATSMIQTAEGALNESHEILQRMRELANQSANDTYTAEDRAEIQEEVNQLAAELSRIADTTEFNTQSLLDGSLDNIFHIGANSDQNIELGIGDMSAQALEVGSDGFAMDAGDGVQNVSVNNDFELESFNLSAEETSAVTGVDDIEMNYAAGVSGSNQENFNLVDDQISVESYSGFNWTEMDTTSGNNITIGVDSGVMTVTISGVDGSGNTIQVEDEITNIEDGVNYNAHGVSFEIAADDIDNIDDGNNISLDLNAVASGDSAIGDHAVDSNVTIETSGGDLESNFPDFGTITTDLNDPDWLEGADSISISGNNLTADDGTEEFVVTILDENGSGISSDTYTFSGSGVPDTFSYDNHGIEFEIGNLSDAITSGMSGISFAQDFDFVEGEAVEFSLADDNGNSYTETVTDETATEVSFADGDVTFDIEAFGELENLDNIEEYYEASNFEEVMQGIDVSSHEAANSAIDVLDAAIESVSSERSMLGSVQNRLDHTVANLEVAAENLSAAESRVRDVDMAFEMTEFSKQQILEQAGTAMLAQANQAPQSVLQLLG